MSDTKTPTWFWVVAVLAFLWNLMGVQAFFMQLNLSPEQLQDLPVEKKDYFNNIPFWVTLAFAVAVFGGAIGCLGLLLKKAWANKLLLISLVGVVAQMFYNVVIAKAMDLYGPGDAFMTFMVLVVAILLVWFASSSAKKGWLT